MKEKKPPLGVKPAWMVAWNRIYELISAIERQYDSPNGDPSITEKYAKEIVFQCKIIEQSQKGYI